MLYMKPKTAFGVLTSLCLLAATGLAQSNPAKLRPSDKCWGRDAPVSVHFSNLSGKRILATADDTLYMLGRQNEVLWTWSTQGPPLTDIPVIDSNGVLYVIAFDLTWVALDSATGKEKWRQDTANGRAAYSQIELYKGNMYLVVTDMTGYRHMLADNTMEDSVTLCRGNSVLWGTQIPARARILVKGSKVYWLAKHKGLTLRREILIPRRVGKPLRKICSLAGYD